MNNQMSKEEAEQARKELEKAVKAFKLLIKLGMKPVAKEVALELINTMDEMVKMTTDVEHKKEIYGDYEVNEEFTEKAEKLLARVQELSEELKTALSK